MDHQSICNHQSYQPLRNLLTLCRSWLPSQAEGMDAIHEDVAQLMLHRCFWFLVVSHLLIVWWFSRCLVVTFAPCWWLIVQKRCFTPKISPFLIVVTFDLKLTISCWKLSPMMTQVPRPTSPSSLGFGQPCYGWGHRRWINEAHDADGGVTKGRELVWSLGQRSDMQICIPVEIG